jgi:hypothetical protein
MRTDRLAEQQTDSYTVPIASSLHTFPELKRHKIEIVHNISSHMHSSLCCQYIEKEII